MNKYIVSVLLALHFVLIHGTDIEGTIIAPSGASSNWAVETKVRVDGKRYFGFVKPDGSFVISEVPPGSYLVEFTNPTYLFQVIFILKFFMIPILNVSWQSLLFSFLFV